LDTFVQRVHKQEMDGVNTFESAGVTDHAIAMILEDACRTPAERRDEPAGSAVTDARRPWPVAPSGVRRTSTARWADRGRRAVRWIAPKVAHAARRATARVTGKVSR
jgi:hypothetical protein